MGVRDQTRIRYLNCADFTARTPQVDDRCAYLSESKSQSHQYAGTQKHATDQLNNSLNLKVLPFFI